jgi:hypothetical protein
MTKDLDKKIIELMDLFDDEQVTTADQIKRPEKALEKQAIDDFMKRNPMAGGGMLVQPGFGGTRQGYAEDLPEGISIRPHGKFPDRNYYTYQIQKDGKVKSNMLRATPENLIKIVQQREAALDEFYPNRTSETEFTKLRKKYSKLNAEDFAKKLNKLGKKTFLGKDFNKGNVMVLMARYGIKSEMETAGGFKKRPISEVKKIIRESSGGLEFIKKFGDNENMLRKKAYTLKSMASKKTSTFSKGVSNESKQWLSFFRASNGGDRIKMIGTFDNKDISNIDNWPRNEKGKIDWGIKGADGEPAWKSVRFVDTEAPVKNATFEWNTEKKPNGQYKYVGGNLKNQIDSVFGEGFFRKSTAAYDLQAMSGTKNIMYKGQSLPPKRIIAKRMIESEYKKKYGKLPSEDYVQRRLNFVSFQEAHHPYGVANDPYFTELASKSANSRLTNIESKYKTLIKKNPANKNKLINDFKKEVRDLSAEYGNIRTGQVIDTGGLFGKKATPRELYLSGLAQAEIKVGSPLYKKLMPFCPKSSGGEAGVCTIQEAMDGLVKESEQFKSGKMSEAQAKKTAQKIRAVTRVGTGTTLTGLLGPYGLAGEVVIDGGLIANRMLSDGDTYKESLSKSLLKYAMPKDARERLEKETDRNTMILGTDTKGLSADFADALKKDADLKQKYENYLKVNQEGVSSLDDPYSSGTTPMFSTGDKNKAERELLQALERSEPTYGKNIYNVLKFGSPEQQAFAAKEEVFDAKKMQNRMDYDKKILGPIKNLFDTGFYSPAQLDLLQKQADRESLEIGQIPDELKTQQIADFGGVANLAKGGRAGFSKGSLRKGVQSLIDDSVKKTPKDITSDLTELIKETLDEDFLDKKDRIIDTLNVKAARERKKYSYNQQVQEEPSQLNFYDDIVQSNFRR